MELTDEEIKACLGNRHFPHLKNTRILDVAKGKCPDKLPVWIMRQAGRYLPEFQSLRANHEFFEICQNPQLACEVTMMPIRRFDLDAAIIFSDILVIPQAMGMECSMIKDKGPVFKKPLTLENMPLLKWDNAVEKLKYVGEAITLTRHQLAGKVPLIGFAACPWTLFVYMVEGGGTKTASKAKKLLYAHRVMTTSFLVRLGDLIVDYLVMQVQYGAQMLQLFESSAEYLTHKMYKDIMIPIVSRIRKGVANKCKAANLDVVPMIFFAKGGGHFLDLQCELGFEVIGLDWSADVEAARKLAGASALQGNLDPCALYASRDDLKKNVDKMLATFGREQYIVNLGHGIYPDAPIEAVKWLIEFVHNYEQPQ